MRADPRDVRIPKLGPGTVEADLLSLHVGVGDRVEAGQEIAEVEGEKSSLVIESPVAEVLLDVGATYAIGAVVCRIQPDG
jgi:pyruvate/2-oxoglutarate dehydrogenase complex dihydrolipoamide acyltransferase (E2) component